MDDAFEARATTVVGPPVSLALQSRGECAVVGRAAEMSAIHQEVAAALRGQLAAISFEGEPGIGKSRLLIAAMEVAAQNGLVPVAVTADEELRGPFLVARSILGSRDAQQAGGGAAVAELNRALDAISGRDDPTLEGLKADEKLLRVFDLSAVAIRSLAQATPVALLVDDLQWADEDSIRLLRYLVRTVVGVPILLALAVRPEELADSEAAPLLADMERMGIVRRLRLGRLTQVESADLLRELLGGPVEPTSAVTMHAQAEGVPFNLQEIARTYREAGLVQQLDRTWRLARNAERLVPSGVRTLVERRGARIPERTRAMLAEAAVIGRSFSLKDLLAVKDLLADGDVGTATELAELIAPAVTAGLLTELPETAPADYRFVHEQVRDVVAASLTPPRRRALHGALVQLLTAAAEPSPESLPLLARHALEAGDTDRAARFAIDAVRAALVARAPEEALRLVDQTLPVVPVPQDRIALLVARDDALEMLHRSEDRSDGLAELAALAEALGDAHLELETMLRRAAAFRLSGESERAAELAADVRELAIRRGDRRAQLHACLELGQAALGKPLGESFSPSVRDDDLDRAAEAFQRACALARELGDVPAEAAATRELAVVANARARKWFIEFKRAGHIDGLLERIAGGADLDDVVAELEVAPIIAEATSHFERAIELFEQLDDRRGLMSAVIALAYLKFGPDIHFQGSARRIEEIRHLATQLLSLSRESERGRAEAQMLYGAHVFARAKVVPDLALSRGAEAFGKAHLLGERLIEFLAAGGVAMVHLELGDVDEAEQWIGRAAQAAVASPTPLKARQLALWRGRCLGVAGDTAGMRLELERCIRLADEQGRPAARCEARARLALEAARTGSATGDEELLGVAERTAREAQTILPSLPGHALWGAEADAALIRVALAHGDASGAAVAARRAIAALEAADREDGLLEIRLPVARGLLAGGTEEERDEVSLLLRTGLMLIAQRIVDEDVRVRWFRGPLGRELTELGGDLDEVTMREGGLAATLDDRDVRLLRLLVEGRTNAQIAEELDVDTHLLERQLAEFYARIGTRSRAQATTLAFRERII